MPAPHLRHHLTPDDLAAAYKQLLQVERGWRDMKGALGLRPVFHYREDRLPAHVQLCWPALLLLRVVENATDDTWRNVRHELDRMHLITLATTDGQVAQRSATTAGQKSILAALKFFEPSRFFDFTRRQRLTGHHALRLAVVTRPCTAFAAFPQVNAMITKIVCSSSAEVRTESDAKAPRASLENRSGRLVGKAPT